MWCSTSSTASASRRPRIELGRARPRRRRRARRRARRAAAAGCGDQRPGQRHPLLHRVGQAAGAAVGDVGHAEPLEHVERASRAARARRGRSAAAPSSAERGRPVPVVGPDHHVLERGQLREQPDALQRARDAEPGELVRPHAAVAAGRASGSRPRPAARSRRSTLNSVVLPAPFGPMTPTTCPGATDSDTLSSAVRPPKRTDTPSTLSSGGASSICNNLGERCAGSIVGAPRTFVRPRCAGRTTPFPAIAVVV